MFSCSHVAATAAAMLMFVPAANADWEQFQGDAGHTGYAPGTVNAPALRQIWSVAAPSYSAGPGDRAVAISGGQVYASMLNGYAPSGNFLVSRYDAATGALQWQTSIPSNSHSGVSAPVVSGGRVYLHHWGHSGSSGSTTPEHYPALVGLDRQTGNRLFWTTHDGQWSSGSRPTVHGNGVYAAGGYYGGLDAYHLNGTPHWSAAANQQYDWIPAADDNNVYVYMGEASASPGPSVGQLYIYNRNTGARTSIAHPRSAGTMYSDMQSAMLGGLGDAFALTYNSHPAYDNSVTLARFNIASRTISWEVDGNFSGNPAVANGVVAIPDRTWLRFLDQTTGAELWKWNGTVGGNVVLTDSHAFVNVSGTVHAIDLVTHQSVWSAPGISGELAFDGGLLIVSNPQGVRAFAVPEPAGVTVVVGALAALSLRRSRRPMTR